MSVYLDITRRFNEGRLRAIITSGQAVVLHRLAIMSKDGDWILREDEEALAHILNILDSFNAKYRFGAPLSLDWLKNGWSSHFEFTLDNKRIRTDFFTRPPRISFSRLSAMWNMKSDLPFVSETDLAETKKTMRMKDYAVIGELARIMKTPEEKIFYSRSARDLINLRSKHPDIYSALENKRPVLKVADNGLEALELSLFEEQLRHMKEDENRLVKYADASKDFRQNWSDISLKLANVSLIEGHNIMLEQATKLLPKEVLHV